MEGEGGGKARRIHIAFCPQLNHSVYQNYNNNCPGSGDVYTYITKKIRFKCLGFNRYAMRS